MATAQASLQRRRRNLPAPAYAAAVMLALVAATSCISTELMPPLDENVCRHAEALDAATVGDRGSNEDMASRDPGSGGGDPATGMSADPEGSDEAQAADPAAPDDLPGDPGLDPGDDAFEARDAAGADRCGDVLCPCEREGGAEGCELPGEVRCPQAGGPVERCTESEDAACLRWAEWSCDDGNPCTDDSCDPAARGDAGGACVYAFNTSTCEDGNACTGSSQCSQGVCVGADPVVCLPASQCHRAGTCDPATGLCSSPEKSSGSPCDDGKACTRTDTCEQGVCVGANPVVCGPASQCHGEGECDEISGVCSYPPKEDGTPCSDGDACTDQDQCRSGRCEPGRSRQCGDPDDLCHEPGVCDPATGSCSETVPIADTVCDDDNPCTADTCVPATGCVSAALPDGTPCEGPELRARWCRAGRCGPAYVHVPSATFTMGSPPDEEGREADEIQHEVRLSAAVWLKETEVTQAEWAEVMGTSPSYFGECGEGCPVERVSWWDALEYCNTLSKREGLQPCYELERCTAGAGGGCADGELLCTGGYSCESVLFAGPSCEGYRLPTEAEWEHAARAGTTTAFFSGDITQADRSPLDPALDAVGWYGGNSAAAYAGAQSCSTWFGGATTCGPQAVAGKLANSWGLYDTTGNVWEWVWDWYDGGYYDARPELDSDPAGPPQGRNRVFRGGSWRTNLPQLLRRPAPREIAADARPLIPGTAPPCLRLPALRLCASARESQALSSSRPSLHLLDGMVQ